MCTYDTATVGIRGSAKMASGWQGVDQAVVYFDHPVHFPAGHALLLDVRRASGNPADRIAIELDAESARQLAATITQILDSVPEDLL